MEKELNDEQIKRLFGDAFLELKENDSIVFNADKTIKLKLIFPLKYPNEDEKEARNHLTFKRCKAKQLKGVKVSTGKDGKVDLGDNISLIAAYSREAVSLIEEMEDLDFQIASEIAASFFSSGQKTGKTS